MKALTKSVPMWRALLAVACAATHVAITMHIYGKFLLIQQETEHRAEIAKLTANIPLTEE